MMYRDVDGKMRIKKINPELLKRFGFVDVEK